jgi:hypothetical protein
MLDRPSNQDQRQALQRFVVANRDLAKLEALAKRFPIFEALGAVRAERKHSNFLGFLLDPKGSHGLGDRFLKRFLQAALEIRPSVAPLAPIDIDLLDLSQAELRIEHEGIDVLIRDSPSHLSVIIENKIDTTQHSDQLAKYYERELKHYPKRTIFGIYLTLDKEEPENIKYAPVSHSDIRTLLNEVSAAPDLRIEQEVQFALGQYTDVLGRHFMAAEQIKALCEKLYRQHKQAIDLIISHLPDPRAAIRERLKELVEASSTLILDDSSGYVRFIPKSLDLPYFNGGWGWTSTKRFLLFEFKTTQTSAVLSILMGPGDPERRKHIHQFALADKKTFQTDKKLYDKWQSRYRKPFVEGLDSGIEQGQLIQEVESKWQEFVESDLPRIEQKFLAHQWPEIPTPKT